MANDAINLARQGLLNAQSEAVDVARKILRDVSNTSRVIKGDLAVSGFQANLTQGTQSTQGSTSDVSDAPVLGPGRPIGNPIGSTSLVENIVALNRAEIAAKANASVLRTADALADEIIGQDIDEES